MVTCRPPDATATLADAARLLLSDPRLQIKAVAHRLHFANVQYFSYFFRRQTGMSPTEYRQRLGVDRA